MAGDLNRGTLIGRLGKDPEIRNTGNGKPVASFSIATSDKWKDRDGNEKETTEWHNVVVFREATARFCEHYVKKGDQVYVEGQIKTRSWEKDGVKRYSTEIVISDFNGEVRKLGSAGEGRASRDESQYGSTRDRQSSGGRPGADRSAASQSAFDPGDLDDNIPF